MKTTALILFVLGLSSSAIAGEPLVYGSEGIRDFVALLNDSSLGYDFAAKEMTANPKLKLGNAVVVALLQSESDPELCKGTLKAIGTAFGGTDATTANLSATANLLADACGKKILNETEEN